MTMLDIIVQLAKELRGMQIGNRTLQLKVASLKRNMGLMQRVIEAWKAKHQHQHDIAEYLLYREYLMNLSLGCASYEVWRYDYLKAHGFIKE